MSYGSMMLLSLGLVALVSLCVGSLGIYAFTGNRVPGRLLRRIVRHPDCGGSASWSRSQACSPTPGTSSSWAWSAPSAATS